MKRVFLLACLSFVLSGNTAFGQAQWEDFSSNRGIWGVYLGEDPGQTFSIDTANRWMQVTGSPNSGCSYTGCGIYMQFLPPVDYFAYAKNYLQSGTWSADYNRLSFKFQCNASISGQSGGAGNVQIGTYIRWPGATDPMWAGAHYYHFIDPNVYPGKWIYVTLNRTPQHEVGASLPEPEIEDPEWVNGGSQKVHYYDGLTRWYFDTQGGSDWRGVTCKFADFRFYTLAGEPDSLVMSLTGQYSGSRYEATWDAPRRVTGGQAYNIRYSTSSMRVNGFASGTSGGTVHGPDGSDYVSTAWNSPAMAQAPVMYVAIQPAGQSSFTEIQIPASGSATPPTFSQCDVNQDGSVNSADVQSAISSALGTAPCTADLDSSGSCNVVDVQRIITAALGGTCRTGQ
jgi:hypothetical protein